jgi:hypothetical protein
MQCCLLGRPYIIGMNGLQHLGVRPVSGVICSEIPLDHALDNVVVRSLYAEFVLPVMVFHAGQQTILLGEQKLADI